MPRGVDWALQAARDLARDGVEAEVVDLRWLRPLDMELVYESFKKTNRCVIVEESLPMYSFGQRNRRPCCKSICLITWTRPSSGWRPKMCPLPYSKEIELLALPDAQKVVNAVKEIV